MIEQFPFKDGEKEGVFMLLNPSRNKTPLRGIKMKNVKYFVIPAVVLGLSALAWMDTREYRDARANYDEYRSSKQFAMAEKNLADDRRAYGECYAKLRYDPLSKEESFTPEGRSCLLLAAPKIKTVEGALKFVWSAGSILAKNQKDEEIQASAIKVIEAGWQDIRTRKREFELSDRFTEANNHSIIMQLLHGRWGIMSMSDMWATQLQKSEYEVLLPEVVRKQKKRRRELFDDL